MSSTCPRFPTAQCYGNETKLTADEEVALRFLVNALVRN